MSSMTVYRAIAAGEFPAVRIRGRLINHARELLDGGESITCAGALSGFPDPGTFIRAFRRFGRTPTAFVNGYRPLP